MIELGLGRMRLDLGAGQGDFLAVAAVQDHDVLVLFDHHAGEDAAVGRGDDRVSYIPRGSRRWG